MPPTNLRQIKKRLNEQVDKSPGIYLSKRQKQRERFLESAFLTGGRGFLKRVKKYAVTEKGTPLILRPHYSEYLECLGDLRLRWVLTTGCAQVGKTLGHTFLMIDGVVFGKLNGAWFYDSRTSLDQYAPMQFKPPAEAWISSMREAGYRFRRSGDRSINTRFQIDGVNAIFTFVSTSKMSRAEGGMAAAAAAASSFPADFAIMEERSQYAPGAADVCLDRLSNSIVPTRPRRDLGTPGGGLGIESDMEDCDYYFYPHCDCPSCGENIPLDPKGCVLKEVEQVNLLGKKEKTYLSGSGRPIKWWHTDPKEPVKSAYIGCKKCGAEIDDDTRLEQSRYRCIRTGVYMRDFLDGLESGRPTQSYKVGIHMSPLTREGLATEIAVDIIRRGLSTSNPPNWQQQVLGHYSVTEILHLSHAMIRDRIGATVPPNVERDYRIAGMDMGRQEDWLTFTDYYLPPDQASMSVAQIAEKTIRNVVFAEAVVRANVPFLLEQWYVDYGLVDNEPSRETVMSLCADTCLQMGDQVAGAKHTIKYTVVTDGGLEIPCWALRNDKFMLSVFEGFVNPAWDGEVCYRVPDTWNQWLANPSEKSPILHLTGPWRDQGGAWHRGKNNLDDFYMALLFAEAAFYLKLTEDFSGEQMSVGSYIS
jgi:hypothetical protein